jgi:hypothetical protein
MSSHAVQLDDLAVVLQCTGSDEVMRATAKRFMDLAKQRRDAAGPDPVDQDTGEVLPRVWRWVFTLAGDDRSLQQNRFYWGVVLPQIADQAVIDGKRYAADAWHELFKRQYLGFEVVKTTVAGRSRKQVIRRLRSTTALSVRRMSQYLDQVIAFGAADLGVQFQFDADEREAMRYRKPVRKING